MKLRLHRFRPPTVALMLPYPLLDIGLGLAYLLAEDRYTGPSFTLIRTYAPMHVWGWLFLLGGLVLGLVLFFAPRAARVWSLVALGGFFMVWAASFAWAVWAYAAPPGGTVLYLYVAGTHFTAAYVTAARA